MADILRSYGNPMETVNAIMMLYENIKSMVRYPDGNRDLWLIMRLE